MKKILFVCSANVCRSPMAEAIFNALAGDEGLDARAKSTGVRALEDAPADGNATAVLEEAGIPPVRGHRGRGLDEDLLGEADLVLTMSPAQAQDIGRRFPRFSEKVHPLPAYLGRASHESIPDPVGQSMTAYRACVRQLHEYLQELVGLLGRG